MIKNKILTNIAGETDAVNIFALLLTRTIGLITALAGIYFLFQILTGGLSILGAGSDKAKFQEGTGKIINGLIGFIIVLAAIFIVDAVGQLLGLETILNLRALVTAIQT